MKRFPSFFLQLSLVLKALAEGYLLKALYEGLRNNAPGRGVSSSGIALTDRWRISHDRNLIEIEQRPG
jgi:hypothetical protein